VGAAPDGSGSLGWHTHDRVGRVIIDNLFLINEAGGGEAVECAAGAGEKLAQIFTKN
jgi:hypothetical protein